MLAVADSDAASQIKSFFSADGYHVSPVPDDLARLIENAPDVLLIDAQLLTVPLRTQLRTHSVLHNLLVVILVSGQDRHFYSSDYPHDFYGVCLAEDIDYPLMSQIISWHLKRQQNTENLEQRCRQLKQLFVEAKDGYDSIEKKNRELQQSNKLSQQKLQGLRTRFHRLIDANPSVIYATDIRNNYACVFVSKRLKVLLGYEPDEMIRDSDFWYEHLDPDEREAVVETFKQLVEQGFGSLFYRFRAKNGHYKFLRDDFSIIKDSQGEPLELVGTWSDLTNERKLDNALRGMSQALDGKTGSAFFQSMARQIIDSLDLDCALIGEFLPDLEEVRTLAMAYREGLQDNVSFAVKGSPAAVLQERSGVYMVSEGVCRRFPDDRLLARFQAQSYFGICLGAGDGNAIGMIALIGKEAVREVGFIELVLQAYADRAESELEREQAIRTLQTRERHMVQLFEQNPSGILEIDQQGQLLRANPRSCQILGYDSPDQLIHQNIEILLPDADRERQRNYLLRYFSEPYTSALSEGIKFKANRRDGSEVALDIYLAPIEYEEETRVILTITDVTQQREQEQAIYDLNRAYTLLSECNQAVVHTHTQQELLEKICQVAVGTGGYELVWIAMSEPSGERMELKSSAGAKEFLRDLNFCLQDGPQDQGEPWLATFRDNQPVVIAELPDEMQQDWVTAARAQGIRAISTFPVKLEGLISGVLGFCTSRPKRFSGKELLLLEEIAGDLSFGLDQIEHQDQRLKAQQELRELAYFSPVTGLANRTRFIEDLTAVTTQESNLAVVVIKLALLAEVNHSLGYEYGDQLLKFAAQRMSQALSSDTTIAHLGAGVFALSIKGADSERKAAEQVSRVMVGLKEAIDLNGVPVILAYRAGLAMMPRDGTEAEILLRRADIARNTVRNASEVGLFRPAMEPDRAFFTLQSELVRALDENQLELFYQPKLRFETGQISAVEALVRWFHPERGMVPPDQFISIAEKTGLITKITRRVMMMATRQMAVWQQQGLELDMAVNVSVLDMATSDFPDMVADACASAGASPKRLILELTETQTLQDEDTIQRSVHALRELGVRISIDDFGTGYSSMTRLIEMAVSEIKIDQSFVKAFLTAADARAIVQAGIELGHELGLEVVAEGVEDEETLQALKIAGCDLIQGYYLSRPVKSGDLEQWLMQR